MKDSWEFSDVTLVCDEDTVFEAHRIILVAGSMFFETFMRGSKIGSHPHPLVYLRGFDAAEVCALIEYFYSGEASVQQEHLNIFLATAQPLRIHWRK